jgi:hypothetical protein
MIWDISAAVYPNDVNLLDDNIDAIKKNTEALIDASKKLGLEVYADKAKYRFMSRHQNAGQNHDIKMANRSFENMAQFKYLGTRVTNENLIKEEIKRGLNSGNASYHLVQNILFSRPLPKNVKIKIYKTIILLWFCMGMIPVL